MKLSRIAGLTAAVLAAGLTAAYAGGMFQNLPVVGASSTAYCSLYAGDGTTCVEYTPAGPSSLTGNELIPMDTGLASGQQPQTVRLPSTWLHAGTYTVLTSGTSYTVAAGIQNVILNLGAATMAVTMPAAPYDNQLVQISNASSTAVTAFSTVANTGQSFTQGAAPTQLAAQTANTSTANKSSVSYIYQASAAKWFRVD